MLNNYKRQLEKHLEPAAEREKKIGKLIRDEDPIPYKFTRTVEEYITELDENTER